MEQIKYQAIHACLRPPRVAVAYQRRSNWIYSARQAISSLSRIWGGAGAIVVPLNDQGAIAKELSPMLRAYDPDHIAVHAVTVADLAVEQPGIVDRLVNQYAFSGETPDETWARISKEQVIPDNPWEALAAHADGWCSPFKGLRQEANAYDRPQVGSLARDGQPGLGLSLMPATPGDPVYTLGLAAVDPMIALMVESRVGVLPSGARQGVNVIELPVLDEDLPALVYLAMTGEVDGAWDLHNRYVTATGIAASPQPPSALPGDTYLAGTPFARTRRSLVKVTTGTPPASTVCVVGDSAEDHALAVLCDRVFDHGAWMPLKLRREDNQVGRAARRAVRQLGWRARVSGRPVLVVSISEPSDVVARVVTEIEDSLGGEVNINGTPVRQEHLRAVTLDELTEQPDTCFLADERSFDLRRSVPVRQTAGELLLLTPIPLLPAPAAVEHLGQDITWYIDVVVPGHQPPARTAIPSALLQHTTGALPDTVVRASRRGLSFSSRNVGYVPSGASSEARLVQPLLRLPSAEQIFAALAAKHGATVEHSEAGRRAATAIELWGSPFAIAGDLAGEVRRLLDAFIPPRRAEGDYGDGYEIRGDGYLTLRHVAGVLGVDEDQASSVLDRLLMLKVLRRGFLLYCERCRSQAFYPVGAVRGDGFDCLLCDYPSRLARDRWNKDEPEPAWNYALDQVVRNLLKKHGDIPLLASARLATGKPSVLWAPELSVKRADGKSKELDLCLILDGEIVIGEAKFNSRLKTAGRGSGQEARRLVQAAHLLSADQIVLATAEASWARGVADAVGEAIATEWQIGPRPKVVEVTSVGTPSV